MRHLGNIACGARKHKGQKGKRVERFDAFQAAKNEKNGTMPVQNGEGDLENEKAPRSRSFYLLGLTWEGGIP